MYRYGELKAWCRKKICFKAAFENTLVSEMSVGLGWATSCACALLNGHLGYWSR